MAKIGANDLPLPERAPVSFAILDNTHLTERGVRWLCARCRQVVIVTSNPDHPAFGVGEDSLAVIFQEAPSLAGALRGLREGFGCERLTVQSGGTVNAALLREGLVDYVDVVVAPLLVGGRDTPTLVDGPSLTTVEELPKLVPLGLVGCDALEGSYVRLRYRVGHSDLNLAQKY